MAAPGAGLPPPWRVLLRKESRWSGCGAEEDGGGRQHLVGIALRTRDGERQRLPCEQAVLCCGAWSQQLIPSVPVTPVKGQMFSVQAPRQALRRVLFGPDTYLVPRQDGLVVVGRHQ